MRIAGARKPSFLIFDSFWGQWLWCRTWDASLISCPPLQLLYETPLGLKSIRTWSDKKLDYHVFEEILWVESEGIWILDLSLIDKDPCICSRRSPDLDHLYTSLVGSEYAFRRISSSIQLSNWYDQLICIFAYRTEYYGQNDHTTQRPSSEPRLPL